MTPVGLPVLKEYFTTCRPSADTWAYSEVPFRGLTPEIRFAQNTPLVMSFSEIGSPAINWRAVSIAAHIRIVLFINSSFNIAKV